MNHRPTGQAMRPRHARGFTLIELLIAMTLTLMLVYAVAQFYAYVGETVRDGRAQIEMGGQLRAATQRLQQDFYPLMLQANGFREDGFIAIVFAVGVLFCLFFFARPAWFRLKDPSRHPALQRIKTWGELHSTSMEAENEFKSSVRYKGAGIRIADRYAYKNNFFTFDLFRFRDLAWAYKLVTQRRVNFIPAGKTYSAILVFNGGKLQFPAKQDTVDELLQFAATRAPWTIFGFSDMVKDRHKLCPAEFFAENEARRDKLNAK